MAIAKELRETNRLLREIAGVLFEIAGQEEEEVKGPDRYMDGSPR